MTEENQNQMNIEEMEKLVNGDPDILIKKMEELGINTKDLDKDIARVMVKKMFSLNDNQFDAVDFVFWIAYFTERNAEELIIYPETKLGARKEAMETIINKLSFGDKIKIIEDLYTIKKDPLVKFMRQIQDLRNNIAHGCFENLTYGGYHLSDNRAKLKLIANLRDILLKK